MGRSKLHRQYYDQKRVGSYGGVAALDKIKIKTVYCHVASTWNLDVVAYIIHTYIYINTHNYIHTF